jgi:type III restriction enzyme
MKLHFEPNLDYQLQAIQSVVDLFRGQEICRTEFTVVRATEGEAQASFGTMENDLGIGNRLALLDDEILANLRAIQLRNGLKPSETIASPDFTVEMETGTGKTYVYLRTIFELHKQYGFTKFVIVVPSVAIKEGVYKTLQITEEHFRAMYGGEPFDYFLYDSSKLGQVRNYATSPHIQIMVVTVGAINKKDVNNLYKRSEKVNDELPIDLIRATRPVVIVDEPQSVDGGLSGAGRTALNAMNPLCTLRYSATHVDKHHMVYRLDAVDAYSRELVKQIEVASLVVESAYNKPYVRLLKTRSVRGTVEAQVEIDTQSGAHISRKPLWVQDGDDLEQTTKRQVYANCRIGEIRAGKGKELLELKTPGGERFLQAGEAFGEVDQEALKRLMIRRTIHEHLTKERRLAPLGIKVLSLFFLDTVEHYRSYDKDGHPVKGKYARLFEEEYARAAKLPEFVSLFKDVDVASTAEEVHNGYFSIDRRVITPFDEHELKKSATREAVEDDTYNLIMKDKEKLLSFDTKLKFIFSHSALREGWDNPNVFQICALRDMQTERERRQTIGRGLRLCVNQNGERLRGFEVNTLTVIANESYEEFAEHLQKEIEEDTGIRFGIIEPHLFANIPVVQPNGSSAPLGFELSTAIFEHLRSIDMLDSKGKVQDALRIALKTGNLPLPASFEPQRLHIQDVLRKSAGKLEVKNADERRTVKTRRAVLDSAEFEQLWDRIKYKTTYRVAFDNEQLVRGSVRTINDAPPISKVRVQVRKADLEIGKGGVEAKETETSIPISIDERDVALPDILTDLQDRTQLTRRSLARILTESERLADFRRNPQSFIEMAAESINRTKQLALVDGIKYQRVGADYYYAQELFVDEELTGYLKNMMPSEKSVYDHVVYDSAGIEKSFAEQLEKNTAVKVYAKLPDWFKVPTPLGTYNPDWALLVQLEEGERLYFVVETKGSLFSEDLREKEQKKIRCGKAHFKALAQEANPARFTQATNLDDVLTHTVEH